MIAQTVLTANSTITGGSGSAIRVNGTLFGAQPGVFVDPQHGMATWIVPAGANGVPLAVPRGSGLVGLTVAIQRFDLGSGAIVGTHPVLGTILP